MKNRKYFSVLAIGLLITNMDFILQRYISMNDLAIGAIKGFGIGLVLVSLILFRKANKEQTAVE